jgi:hypothetical protein
VFETNESSVNPLLMISPSNLMDDERIATLIIEKERVTVTKPLYANIGNSIGDTLYIKNITL